MNRKNLTAAVLAGLAGVAGIAGTAQAVNINPDGIGQVLVYPYYTTNGENVTLLSVVNTTEYAKAVKVRFLEGQNSQEVLDFNLYMSAYDVWTAAIAPQPADAMDTDCDFPDTDVIEVCGGPVLKIGVDENTCTVPDLNKMQSFLPFQYDGDKGVTDHSRMNEGHFEMIEMGVLTDEGFDPEAAATHGKDANGDWMPADCAALVNAWSTIVENNVLVDQEWIVDPTEGLDAPNGGLFGGAAIVNVKAGSMHTYDATAINGWSETGMRDGIFSNHTTPGSLFPSLDSGDQTEGKVFTDTGTALSSGDLGREIDAVSFVFMHDQIMNEYTTEASVAGATEWVLTFPTKRFYVNNQAPLGPFTTPWEIDEDTDKIYADACEAVGLTGLWDREEREARDPNCEDTNTCPVGGGPIVSPKPPGVTPPPPPGLDPFQLCYETNVVRFGSSADLPATTEILGSAGFLNFDNTLVGPDQLAFEYGWARVELADYYLDTDNSGTFDPDELYTRDAIGNLEGLPVVGFSVSRFANGFLTDDDGNNVLSSYGALFDHKATRREGSGFIVD